jgi:hypothetical protein
MSRFALAVSLLLAIAVDAVPAEKLITATCVPSVKVTVPKLNAPQKKNYERRSEVVQVYWDISGSMRDFTTVRKTHGGGQSDDLALVVGALDSNVLLQAHAKTVEQYGVGQSIVTLASARSALSPTAGRTVLHLAAERIGSALAAGNAQAALVVSDLEVDTPPRTAHDATVCGGVPLPSTPEAGSLFGRCFESGVIAARGPGLVRTNLLVHVFRKSSHGRELFILLFAADRDFGQRISDEMARRLGFERQVIFDSGAVAASDVRQCRLSAPAQEMLRTANSCAAKCFDDIDGAIGVQCEIRRTALGAWIRPKANPADRVTYESLKGKPADREERGMARFVIPCTASAGVFEGSVAYAWEIRIPWREPEGRRFAQKETVRDLFDSLADAITRVVAPRTLRIGIPLAK